MDTIIYFCLSVGIPMLACSFPHHREKKTMINRSHMYEELFTDNDMEDILEFGLAAYWVMIVSIAMISIAAWVIAIQYLKLII